MRRLRLRSLWLLFLLALPGVAWLFGARQPLLENRPKVEFPPLTGATLTAGSTFAQIDQAILDRLPLRGTALSVNARLSVELFRDSPHPAVAIGDDGWLYYIPQLQACRELPPLADPADAAEIIARTIRATGRRAVVSVPGGKLTLHPDHAPDIDAEAQRCVRALERRINKRLAATSGGLDIDTELAELERRGEPTFLRGDTHWNALGRERYARAVLDAVRPGLADEIGLRIAEPVGRPGDLWKMVGLQRHERDRIVTVARSPEPPPSGVVLVGDSQLEFVFIRPRGPGVDPLLPKALPGADYCAVLTLGDGACDELLSDARTVVFEIVGRNVRMLTETCWRLVTLYAGELRGRAAALQRADADARDRGRRRPLTLAPGAVEHLRFRPRRRVSDHPRLLMLPVERGSAAVVQQPTRGGTAPCATPGAAAGGTLVLPVPAGRDVTELVVQVATTDGVTLGSPREVVLDATVARREGRRRKDSRAPRRTPRPRGSDRSP